MPIMSSHGTWSVALGIVVGERRRLDKAGVLVVGVERWNSSAATLLGTLRIAFHLDAIGRTGRPLWERKINAVPAESVAILARP